MILFYECEDKFIYVFYLHQSITKLNVVDFFKVSFALSTS